MPSIKLYTDSRLLKQNIPNVTMFPLIDCLTTNASLESNSDFEFVEDQENCDLFLFPIAIEHMVHLGRKKEIRL